MRFGGLVFQGAEFYGMKKYTSVTMTTNIFGNVFLVLWLIQREKTVMSLNSFAAAVSSD